MTLLIAVIAFALGFVVGAVNTPDDRPCCFDQMECQCEADYTWVPPHERVV